MSDAQPNNTADASQLADDLASQPAGKPIAHADLVSAEVADWSRETPQGFWDPSRKLLKSIRDHQSLQTKSGPLAKAKRKCASLRHRFWSVVTGADIPINVQIGGGLLMPHPNGIVVHPAAVIGVNCLLMQQTTLGVSGSKDGKTGAPTLAGHVDIGAGAKVLGPITLGKHSRVGANAVLLQSIEENTTAVGIPAKVLGNKN